ncbi:DUF192 domain-containing protein [Neisseria musculi]
MHRTDMPADEGMLFVFPQTAIQCFWMKNTPPAFNGGFCGSRRHHRQFGRYAAV